ncbi:IPT/TIG domain-containing protein [Niabella hirudinis]|uniref:IPT/TIG domain-containing protein n=1 Tax=Niabella hirudinis TaxID=1285929 RepID=UPI003EBEC78F
MKSHITGAWMCMLLWIIGCNKDKERIPQHEAAATAKTNITKALASIDSLSTFAVIFKEAPLADADVAAGFTALAPVNAVFTDEAVALKRVGNIEAVRVMTAGNARGAVAANNPQLKDGSVISDYIIKGKITVSTLTNGSTLVTLSGKTLPVSIHKGAVYLNGVRVSQNTVYSASDYNVYTLPALINYPAQLAFDPVFMDHLVPKLPGDTLVVTGQNFSADAAGNQVMINGVPALVHEAAAGRLLVTVPANATSGPITVTVNNKTITSSRPLTVLKVQVSTIAAITGLHCGQIGGIVVDKDNTLYFSDPEHNRVISYSTDGQTTIYQPTKINGDANGDGIINEGDRVFVLDGPAAITIDDNQRIYVATGGGEHGLIYQLTPGNTTEAVLWAGKAQPPVFITGDKMKVGMYPQALKAGSGDTIYYSSDSGDDNAGLYRIRGNTVSLVANSIAFKAADAGVTDDPDLFGIEADRTTGALYLADQDNYRIWKMVDGQLSVVAGSGNWATKDGVGREAGFASPAGLALDGRGNLFVGDNDDNALLFTLRMINPYGVVTTLAGGVNPGYQAKDGNGRAALFAVVNSLARDAAGNLYAGDDYGNIRKITFVL